MIVPDPVLEDYLTTNKRQNRENTPGQRDVRSCRSSLAQRGARLQRYHRMGEEYPHASCGQYSSLFKYNETDDCE